MATRRENGMGSMLRRTQRSENASPYKRKAPSRRSPPAPAKISSSSSLSSFLSLLSAPFRRKPASPSPPVHNESEASDDDASDDADHNEDDEQGSSEPEQAPELGFGPPPKGATRHTLSARDPDAASTLSQMGRSLQQSIPQPKVLPASTFLRPPVESEPTVQASASAPHIAPLDRPRRNVQPAFATTSRAGGAKRTRPSFPGGIGSYGGFGSTAEPSPPPFAANGNPLESSFAANRTANSNTHTNGFSFPASKGKEPKPAALPASRALHGKSSSEVLAEFFASKGKAPLTAEERKRVAQLIEESEAEENPESDPYNGVPSFSFLKSSFPATKSESISPSNSVLGTTFSFNVSTSSAGSSQLSTSVSAPALGGAAVPPRRRRPINYGGSNKRSAAITKAGFTVREHQKLLEKQKQQQQAAEENIAPDPSVVGDKRGAREVEEDGGGKRRRMNDGLGLSAQPSVPSPLRQVSKFDSPPEQPRAIKRAMAPSPSSPLPKPVSVALPSPAKTTAAPPTPAKSAKPKPRTSIVADVMRDMLAEDKQREKKEQDKERDEVFANPYDELIPVPAVTVPKIRKPRRVSARPAARSEASKRKEPESKPLSLIEKIEQTDVQPKPKKAKTDSESPAPTPAPFQPPTFIFTAPSPKETKPKARRPAPIVEEPVEGDENQEIEVIDLDEDEKSKPQTRPELKIDMHNKATNGSERNVLLGVPRQRPSFSLHSPARPSPLREMSVPIDDDIEEIEEIEPPTAKANGAGPFGSTAGSGPFGSSTTNGFGSSTNGFGSNAGFGSTTSGFGGFGSTASTTTTTSNNATLSSFGFTVPTPAPAPAPAAPVFSAPLPPPAPTLAPARLPTPVKNVLKTQSPLFTPQEEKEVEVVEVKEVEKPKEVELPKAEPPKVEEPAAPVVAPAPMTEAQTKLSVKDLPVSSLPAFTFTASVLVSATKVPDSAEARAATQVPVSKLPTFSFGSKFTSTPTPAPVQAFNWEAAGMKAPSAPSGDQWKCGTCSCMSLASAAKCTVCEAPKPASVSAPAPVPAPAPAAVPIQAFNWGAAGLKAPAGPSGDQWKCGTCDCMSPASAVKCTVCETPKPSAASAAPTPSSAPAPAPAPVQAFNWAAAGMKAPVSAGAWSCSVCGLRASPLQLGLLLKRSFWWLQLSCSRLKLYTSVDLVKAYLARIEEVNLKGPALRAVIETNPLALEQAAALDIERKRRGRRSPLHGIPILLKDVIATMPEEGMNTTAGSYALLGSVVSGDATVAAKLRKSGAILLGKTNLSEWSSARGQTAAGWSGRGGQATNPYYPGGDPQGSSSGSAIAAAIGLAAGALVVPVVPHWDTVGPITRTVEDGAVILNIIAGRDEKDNYTSTAPRPVPDYTQYLDRNAIKGKRFGVPRVGFMNDTLTGNHPSINLAFENALQTIRSLGGIVIDPADLPSANELIESRLEYTVADIDIKVEINKYFENLKSTGSGPHNLAEVIAYNDANKELEEPKGYEDQDGFLVAQSTSGYNSQYYTALRHNYHISRTRGIDAALVTYELDALILPSNGPTTTPAAFAGYPIVTVPLGFHPENTVVVPKSAGPNTLFPAPGIPFGLAFLGSAYSEPSLIGFAYAYEQETHTRLQRRAYPMAIPKTQLEGLLVQRGSK
ncbi:amidase [Ceratobasidium sp. AG-Ba]|nr:amidase [Ceratobasidium sp. AG-Ba]